MAEMVEAPVPRRGEDIRLERVHVRQPVALHPDREEQILHDLLGDGLRLHVAIGDLAQRRVHRAEELLERRKVAASNAVGQVSQRPETHRTNAVPANLAITSTSSEGSIGFTRCSANPAASLRARSFA